MDTPLSFFNDGTNTWELSVVNGQPKWTVSTARNEEMMKESSAVDASGLGEQPPSTTTLEELSFSEQVPSSTRMSLREEIMDQKMDSELEEIQSKVKAHRLQDRIPGQSFKVFHPDTAKAMPARAGTIERRARSPTTGTPGSQAPRTETIARRGGGKPGRGPHLPASRYALGAGE